MPRRDRVAVFRDFVRQTFTLGPGVVLDVAGGKGDLSWLLANADGLKSVVVDPRPTDHRKISRTALWYWDRRDDPVAQLTGQEDQALATMGLAPPYAVPLHLRMFWDDEAVDLLQRVEALGDHAGQSQVWVDFWARACARAEALEPPGHHQPRGVAPLGQQGGRVRDASHAFRVLKSTQLVLGFHPDEATEPCIDLALWLQVPFAVSPCCVFAKAFPPRGAGCKKGRRRVTSYGDFVAYLRRKHPRMRMAQLDFGFLPDDDRRSARNDVLFMLPGDFDLGPEVPLGGCYSTAVAPRESQASCGKQHAQDGSSAWEDVPLLETPAADVPTAVAPGAGTPAAEAPAAELPAAKAFAADAPVAGFAVRAPTAKVLVVAAPAAANAAEAFASETFAAGSPAAEALAAETFATGAQAAKALAVDAPAAGAPAEGALAAELPAAEAFTAKALAAGAPAWRAQ